MKPNYRKGNGPRVNPGNSVRVIGPHRLNWNRNTQTYLQNAPTIIPESVPQMAIHFASQMGASYRNIQAAVIKTDPVNPNITWNQLTLNNIFTTYIPQEDGKRLVIDQASIRFEIEQITYDTAVTYALDHNIIFDAAIAIAKSTAVFTTDETTDFPLSLDACLDTEYTPESLGQIVPPIVGIYPGGASTDMASKRAGIATFDVTTFFTKMATRYESSLKTGDPFPKYFLIGHIFGKNVAGTTHKTWVLRSIEEIAYHYTNSPNKI